MDYQTLWMQLEVMAKQVQQTAEQEIVPRFGKVKAQYKAAKFKAEEAVTEADLAASKVLLQFARQQFPQSFSEEELPKQALTDPYVWTIDPVDGTDEFIAGIKTGYACQAALLEQKTDGTYISIAGVVYRPGTQELLYGTAEHVVYSVNGVTQTLPKLQATSLTGWVRATNPDPNVIQWYEERNINVYQGGGAGACWLDFCTGKLNVSLFKEPYSKCWDTAPGEPLVAAVGGKLTSSTGQSFRYSPNNFYNSDGWLLTPVTRPL